jgi:hypothetical protein
MAKQHMDNGHSLLEKTVWWTKCLGTHRSGTKQRKNYSTHDDPSKFPKVTVICKTIFKFFILRFKQQYYGGWVSCCCDRVSCTNFEIIRPFYA